MVAGTSSLRSYNASNFAQQAVDFVCLGPGNETKYVQNQNCPGGLRAQIFFPSCWDGVNVDSPDHKSHVAYPLGAYNSGTCSPAFPVRLIALYYEVIWNINPFANMWYGPSHPFVFSNGDPTGYGYHGDFINGWDVNVLQQAVSTCNSTSGLIQECGVFNFTTDAQQAACTRLPDFAETVRGTLAALPGCNPVQSGPAAATPAVC
jgi:hypothetical protein